MATPATSPIAQPVRQCAVASTASAVSAEPGGRHRIIVVIAGSWLGCGRRFQSRSASMTPLGMTLARAILAAVSALEVLLVVAVLVGISVQAAIGFGFAFFVAPAAFAAFSPEQAVTLVLLLARSRSTCLVLFARAAPGPRSRGARSRSCSPPRSRGWSRGAWLVTRGRSATCCRCWSAWSSSSAPSCRRSRRPTRPDRSAAPRDGRALEVGGGLAAGALTTSVSVNGPALVLVFTRLGLRGARLRDSLAAALLGLSLLALPVVLDRLRRRARPARRLDRPSPASRRCCRPSLRRGRLPPPRRRLPPPRRAGRRGARRRAQHRRGAVRSPATLGEVATIEVRRRRHHRARGRRDRQRRQHRLLHGGGVAGAISRAGGPVDPARERRALADRARRRGRHRRRRAALAAG